MQTNTMPEGLVWPQFEDGTPVNIGDEVVYDDLKFKVQKIIYDSGYWTLTDGRLYPIECMTKNGQSFERPFNDSWEKLEEDAEKYVYNYWNCEGYGCQACPAEINGKKPDEYYDCRSCVIAAQIDIVTRAKKIAEHERNER